MLDKYKWYELLQIDVLSEMALRISGTIKQSHPQ